MKLFHPVGTVDWTRFLIVVSAATAFWTAMSAVIPAKFHRVGESLLTGVTAATTILIRSNKWSPRQESLTEAQAEQK